MIKAYEAETTSREFRLREMCRTIIRTYALQSAVAGVLWQYDETDKEIGYVMGREFTSRSPIKLDLSR